MEVRDAYNSWAEQYDSNDNKTRDLEAKALRSSLGAIDFKTCLEIGCGTGKNTVWFKERASQVTSVDLSEEMLLKAKEKIDAPHVTFVQADINEPWNFIEKTGYDLVNFSLVLEHIENLDHIFMETAAALNPGGYVYIGELHPFKQYSGSKARFETAEGIQVVNCFDHHISDFIQSAGRYGLMPVDINEYFDNDDRTGLPRILTIILKKS